MAKKRKKSNTKYVLLGIGIIFVVGIAIALQGASNSPGEYDEFAQCLVDSGAKMYSAWWCPHCQEQKRLFGNSFKILDEGGAHVECSPGGTRSFSQFCQDEGIEGTPTWRFADGTELGGRQPLETLAAQTGCPLNP